MPVSRIIRHRHALKETKTCYKCLYASKTAKDFVCKNGLTVCLDCYMKNKYGLSKFVIKLKDKKNEGHSGFNLSKNCSDNATLDQSWSVGMKRPSAAYQHDKTETSNSKYKHETVKNINNNDIPRSETHHFPLHFKAVILVLLAIIGPFIVFNDIAFKSNSQSPTFHHDDNPTNEDYWNHWHEADANTLQKYSSAICSIEKVYVSDMSIENFERNYKNRKPVIIQFEHGAADWTDISQWTPSRLIEKHSSTPLLSGKPREIVRHGGNGDTETTLQYFLTNFMNTFQNTSEYSDQYVFDRNFFKDSSLKITPPYFLENKEGIHDSMFFLGATTSGVSFHKHAEAWNAVLFGQKRWFLYPKIKSPPGGMYPGYSQLDWFNSVYPHLTKENKPIECVQQAGEILYLPESMYHSTINLGDTLAIGVQKIQANTEIEKLFYEDTDLDKKGLPLKRLTVLKKLLKLLPENAEVHLKLGSVYESLSDMTSAEGYYKQAARLDPLFLVALLNIARLKSKNDIDAAEATFLKVIEMNPNMWDSYAEYGTFLMKQKRFKEAVNIFTKGCKLQPTMPPFWEYLKYCQQSIGDTEGVKHSEQQLRKLNQK